MKKISRNTWVTILIAAVLVAAVLISIPFLSQYLMRQPFFLTYRLVDLSDMIAEKHIYWEEGDDPLLIGYQRYFETEDTPKRAEVRHAFTKLFREDPEIYYEIANLMLSHYDRYSKLVTPSYYDELYPDSESYGGLGMVVTANGPFIGVVNVYEDSAAGRAGILPDDRVVMVNGRDIRPMPYEEASDCLAEVSKNGGTVTILREAGQPLLTFDLTPEAVVIPNVDWSVDDDVAYLDITLFEGETFTEDIDAAIADFRAAEATSLILDLRDNRGGRITYLLHLLNALTAEEDELFFTQAKRDETKENRSDGTGMAFEQIVVLVDANTCSSAEVTAGYFKDLGWPVIGTLTYGKGIGTSTYDFYEDSLVLATIDIQLPKTGRYNAVGIEPTIEQHQEYPIQPLPALAELPLDAVLNADSESDLIQALEERLVLLGYIETADGAWDTVTAGVLNDLQTSSQENGLALLENMMQRLERAFVVQDTQLMAAYELLKAGQTLTPAA